MKKQLHLIAPMAGLIAALAALSVWGQAGPTLKITAPKKGEKIAGDSVTVRWESSGVKIVPAADAKMKEEAHFHIFVDRKDWRAGVEIPRDMEKEGIYHTAKTSQELKGLKPGKHEAHVVLSYNNHVPWDPPVTASVTFEAVKKKK